MHWSASQTLHFAIHRYVYSLCSLIPLAALSLPCLLCSLGILEPLLPAKAREEDLAWLSWKRHVEYVVMSLSHSYDRQKDIPRLAQMIKNHHAAYTKVPEYRGLMKPKNHMAVHFPHVLSDAGPLRYIW